MIEIGKRERVVDIRTLWKYETEFSDWLITEEGIGLLIQDMDIQIENPIRECRPGNYPCDIVASLIGDENHVVVIENQFGKTNHDHLGKFLTYASVHKAMTGIWITEHASDDHRQVIDWLNENTPPTVNLYLAELKAYRIGNSSAAPQLDVICRPNLTQKLRVSNESEADRERHIWRQKFWEEIHAAIMAKKPPFRLQKTGTNYWSSITIGRSGFSLAMLLTPRNQSIGIDLSIGPDGWENSAFGQLQVERHDIETEIGLPLQWMPLPGRKRARILLETKIDPSQDCNRRAVCDWFCEKLILMYNVFKPRIAKLQSDFEPDSDAASASDNSDITDGEMHTSQ